MRAALAAIFIWPVPLFPSDKALAFKHAFSPCRFLAYHIDMDKQVPPVRGRTIVLCIILFFVLDRALSLGLFLPGFCVEDERWIRNSAVKMVTDLEYDPGTHKYPGLMPELTAMVYLGSYLASNYKTLLHFQDFESFAWHLSHYSFDFASTIALGRLLAVVLGALAIYLFFVYARKEFGETEALLGSLFLCTSPAFLFSTQLLKNDVLVVIGVFLVLFCGRAMVKNSGSRYHVLGGLALGFCMAAKYHLPALVPLLFAHRLQGRDRPFLQSFFNGRLLLLLFFSFISFALLSPGTVADLSGAARQAILELSIQNRFDPLFRRSAELWWHAPVIFIFAAVLPLALGVPLYLLSLAGFITKSSFRQPAMLVMWSYPAALLVFMIGLSELGVPHLFTPAVPFFALAAALFISPLVSDNTRKKKIAGILLVGLVSGSNLFFMHSLNYYEDYVLGESVDLFESRAEKGMSVAFVPYYPNPEINWKTRFVPQPFLSEEKLKEAAPERILIHHAFYHAYSNNKELLESPEVSRMYRTYLLLRAGKLGYRESVRFTEHDVDGGTIFMGGLYKFLWPDLAGLKASIYVKEEQEGG